MIVLCQGVMDVAAVEREDGSGYPIVSDALIIAIVELFASVSSLSGI